MSTSSQLTRSRQFARSLASRQLVRSLHVSSRARSLQLARSLHVSSRAHFTSARALTSRQLARSLHVSSLAHFTSARAFTSRQLARSLHVSSRSHFTSVRTGSSSNRVEPVEPLPVARSLTSCRFALAHISNPTRRRHLGRRDSPAPSGSCRSGRRMRKSTSTRRTSIRSSGSHSRRRPRCARTSRWEQ